MYKHQPVRALQTGLIEVNALRKSLKSEASDAAAVLQQLSWSDLEDS